MHVHHVPLAGSDKSSEPKGPEVVAATVAEADGTHTRLLELFDEVVLPRQHEGALDVKALVIVRPCGSGQQMLGTARTETFDHPQHANRHPRTLAWRRLTTGEAHNGGRGSTCRSFVTVPAEMLISRRARAE